MYPASCCKSAGITSSGSGAGSGMRTSKLAALQQREALAFGRPTTCDGSIIGTLDMLMRSCVFDVNPSPRECPSCRSHR